MELTPAVKKRALVLASAAVVLAAAFGLGYQLREWTASRSAEEGVGERLRRECASIVDAAGGPKVSKVDVVRVLEENPEIVAELRRKGIPDAWYSKKVDALEGRPAWNDGLVEALQRERERMIESCVLKRGLGSR